MLGSTWYKNGRSIVQMPGRCQGQATCKNRRMSNVLKIKGSKSYKEAVFHIREVRFSCWYFDTWTSSIKRKGQKENEWLMLGMQMEYLIRLLVWILVSELCNSTSYHFTYIGLHKQMSAIQNMYNKLLWCRQRSVHIDNELCHRYVTAKGRHRQFEEILKEEK